jgi:hypothetical protein
VTEPSSPVPDGAPYGAPDVAATPAPVEWQVEPAPMEPSLDAVPVPWQPSKPGPISIGGVLGEVLARYAADGPRLFGLLLVPSVLALAMAGSDLAWVPTILNLVGLAIAMALVDAGPGAISLRVASGRGLRRVGWLLLTLIVFGILVFLAVIIPSIVAGFVLLTAPVVGVVAILVAFALAFWVAARLLLAIPAVVVDPIGPGDAIGRAWRMTRPIGLLLRLGAVYLVSILFVLIPSFAAGFTRLLDVPLLISIVAFGLAVGVVAPITPVALVVLYRRVGGTVEARPSLQLPPLSPSAASSAPPSSDEPPAEAMSDAMSDALAAPEAVATPDAVATEGEPPSEPVSTWLGPPPATTRRTRVIAVVAVTVLVGSLAASAVALGTLASQGLVPAGAVPPGQVVFGTTDSLITCTVMNPVTIFGQGAPIAWIARYDHRSSATDEVKLRVMKNGQVIIDETERPDTASCLGSDGPETGVPAGAYDFTVLINGVVTAHGTMTVLP